jgi:hypothetical protein
LSATDKLNVRSSAQRAARRAQAETFAADIQRRAGELAELDKQVGSGIARAAEGVGSDMFGNPGHIQAVNNEVCNDPDYAKGIERRLWGSVLAGAAVGGLGGSRKDSIGSFEGAIVAGAIAGILDLIHETLGDGPKCQD